MIRATCAHPTASRHYKSFSKLQSKIRNKLQNFENWLTFFTELFALSAFIMSSVDNIPNEAANQAAATSSKQPATASKADKADKEKSKRKPKIPKGTRDSTPEQMVIREKAFKVIETVFNRHGAVGIDTPVFELKETLTGKYGEDSKLIYDLADQGGEICALRYDLTVPFARYVAAYSIDNIKRYHIARVYRRDQPAMQKGRFREFYQCDFDIAGTYSPMLPDSECVCVLSEILDGLQIGPYKIKLNHRALLDGIMAVCGVPADKFRTICSAIDKLDKEPWKDVKHEMTVIKGLDEEVADKIGTYVTREFGLGNAKTLLEELKAIPSFQAVPNLMSALNDLATLFDYLEAFSALSVVSFDLSLARGLDYYTGVIYEAVLTHTDRVGSIAAGGRYDTLVGQFSNKPVPSVGVSVGIERILAILEEMELSKGKIRKNQTHVLVGQIGSSHPLVLKRLQLCKSLWSAGVNAEYLYEVAPKPKKQMDSALGNQVPMIVWIGGDEEARGVVKLKVLSKNSEREVAWNDVVSEVLKEVKEIII